MAPCIIFGSYNGHGAIVSIDPTIPTSHLSSRFAEEHRLRNLPKCPMRLPSIGGVYVSRMHIDVDPSLTKFDLVIGADWIKSTGAVLTPHGLAQPSKRDVLRLKLRRTAGHSWVAISKGRLNKPKAEAKGSVGEAYGPFHLPLSISPHIPPSPKGHTRRGIEVPFDITHHILRLLIRPTDPHSYGLGIDVITLQRLCLVSRSFNLAASAILYSSIAISEITLHALSSTACANPGLFNHCHSIWFQPPLYPHAVITWGTIAHIISCCPNLRRVEWIHGPGSVRMSIFSWHLPQLTDMLFPHISLSSLRVSPTIHLFPYLERLVVANAHFTDPAVVEALIHMPRLTALITDPPRRMQTHDVEAYARGVATVVMHTALRRIIWAHIHSTENWDKTVNRAEFDLYRPICSRVLAMFRASPVSGKTFKDVLRNAANPQRKRPSVKFEFIPLSVGMIRNGLFDGSIWNPYGSSRATLYA